MKHENLPRSVWVVNLLPANVPPAEIRPYWGPKNHWFPLICKDQQYQMYQTPNWQGWIAAYADRMDAISSTNQKSFWLKEFSFSSEGWELGFGLYETVRIQITP